MLNLGVDVAVLVISSEARLAQSAERKALNIVVVGSSPTVGAILRSVMALIELHDANTHLWLIC